MRSRKLEDKRHSFYAALQSNPKVVAVWRDRTFNRTVGCKLG